MQPRFGEAIEVYRPTTRNPDRISFMEYGENPTYLNDRFGVQSDDRYRKKPSYGVAYISPPQDPYLTDTARIKDLKNLQTFRQGDDIQKTPENSEVNTKENYDNAMSQSDEYYKNSQVYGGLYSNSKQLESHVNQATKDSLENQRPQNEDYKKIDYNDPKPQSQDTRKSSIDDAYRIQQTSTSAQLQYPHVDQKKMESYGNVGIQNDNSYKSQQSYSVSPSLNQGFRDGFPNTYDRNKSNKESSMLLHYPDHNPVLTPNQKITINIEYPTENYNHNAVCKFKANSLAFVMRF